MLVRLWASYLRSLRRSSLISSEVAMGCWLNSNQRANTRPRTSFDKLGPNQLAICISSNMMCWRKTTSTKGSRTCRTRSRTSRIWYRREWGSLKTLSFGFINRGTISLRTNEWLLRTKRTLTSGSSNWRGRSWISRRTGSGTRTSVTLTLMALRRRTRSLRIWSDRTLRSSRSRTSYRIRLTLTKTKTRLFRNEWRRCRSSSKSCRLVVKSTKWMMGISRWCFQVLRTRARTRSGSSRRVSSRRIARSPNLWRLKNKMMMTISSKFRRRWEIGLLSWPRESSRINENTRKRALRRQTSRTRLTHSRRCSWRRWRPGRSR